MSYLRYPLAVLTAGLLLAGCTAAPQAGANEQAATPAASTLAATGLHAASTPDQPLVQDDADLDGLDDLDDPANFDPAAHVRAQLARQPARRGSGGPVQACTLSGKVTLAGMTEDIRDCMQSNGSLSVAEFQQACQGLANGLDQTGNAPAKIEYGNRCPTPAQGSCRNFMNSGMDAFYYQRTELDSLPGSCANAGGRWQAGS